MFNKDYKNTLKEELFNYRNKINEIIELLNYEDIEGITEIINVQKR